MKSTKYCPDCQSILSLTVLPNHKIAKLRKLYSRDCSVQLSIVKKCVAFSSFFSSIISWESGALLLCCHSLFSKLFSLPVCSLPVGLSVCGRILFFATRRSHFPWGTILCPTSSVVNWSNGICPTL